MKVFRAGISLLLSAVLVCGQTGAANTTAVDVRDFRPKMEAILRGSQEIRLQRRNSVTVPGRFIEFEGDSIIIEARGGKPEQVRLDEVLAVSYGVKKRSRWRRMAGGIGGMVGGFLVVAPLAYLIAYDASSAAGGIAALAVLVGCPAAGAVAGAKLAEGRTRWKTVVLRHEDADGAAVVAR